MKAIFTAALLLAGTTAFAQQFNAADWGKATGTAFNSTKTFTHNDDNTLTVAFGDAENANGLQRAEIGNLSTVSLGGDNTVAIFKVTYGNATFINFDSNMIFVRRQLRNESAAATADNALAPYFITDQTKTAGRYATNNKPEDTEAYYWRYLPGLPTQNVTPTIAPDWAQPFEVPSSFANNKAFSYNDGQVYGFSYVGIRINHSKDNASGNPGVLADGANVTFNYIGFTSPEALGFDSADAFNAANNTTVGQKVKGYIEGILSGSAAVENIASDDIALSVAGGIISAEGAAITVYNLAGAKVADGNGSVAVAPGLYVVNAVKDNARIVRKVVVK